MLAEFLTANREAIIASARARVAGRKTSLATDVELRNGIPLFLDQVGVALRALKAGAVSDHEQIDRTATIHGGDLFRMGLTIGQVVHDYGAVCQAITELAVKTNAPVEPEEFQTLNLCLDDAIAGAVSEHSRQREVKVEDEGLAQLGEFSHELRNHLNTAILAFDSIKTGRVAISGSTGAVLSRSLAGAHSLIARTLTAVRLDAGILRPEVIAVADLIGDVEIEARLQAELKGVNFTSCAVESALQVEGDRQLLLSALYNLLQNAIKFTPKGHSVWLETQALENQVHFLVKDECGGLPPGKPEELFGRFTQKNADRSGLGLGLSICLKAARANGGALHVRDRPGEGCVFTLELPRNTDPAKGGNATSGAPVDLHLVPAAQSRTGRA